MTDTFKVTVTDIQTVASSIKEFTLSPVEGQLIPFSAGSHIVVEMPTEEKTYKNAYSLLSQPDDPSHYKIAVRLQDNSRGGSVYMHTQVKVGDSLTISAPANRFAPLWQAKKHILIAGGIGITPFLSYLPEFERRGEDYELHYLYRGGQTGAYCNELSEQLGDRLFCYDSATSPRCNIENLMSQRAPGTHFYICGPEKLIEAVMTTAKQLGIAAGYIHFEEFAAPKPGNAFELELKSSGRLLNVSEEESMLEAIEKSGIEIPNLCRGGVCGQCVCRVSQGKIDHRDTFLTEQERSSGDVIMPCVSRAAGERLTLDI